MKLTNKRNYTECNNPPSKKLKEVPWLNWSEAEIALKTLKATRDFLQKSQTDELYVDDPNGKFFRYCFEVTPTLLKLRIEEWIEQENNERPLVDLSISPDNTASIDCMEITTPALFETAWKITQLTLNLWQTRLLAATDDAVIGANIPRQLVHALQGRRHFQEMGLTTTPEVIQAQDFLEKLTIKDLKGILNGFSPSIAKITRMQNTRKLNDDALVGELVSRLSSKELQLLHQECFISWNSEPLESDSPLLKPYLRAIDTLSAPSCYFVPPPQKPEFRERLKQLGMFDTSLLPQKEGVSIKIQVNEDAAFSSEGLSDYLLRESRRSPNAHYFYLIVEERVGDQNTTVLKLTFSPNGKKAELCWIQKGTRLTGDDVFQIFNQFDEILQPDQIYLFDDAKVFIGEKRDESHEVSLKVLQCLVKRDASFSSWYEKQGFAICDFPKHLPLVRKNLWPTYRYSLAEFQKSKAFIRNTQASFLINSTLKFLPEEQKALLEFGRKYLGKEQFTLHEIFAAVYEQAPRSEDLFTLYSICFKDFEEDSKKLKAYGASAKDYETFADHFDLFSLNPILMRQRPSHE